ncbi:MAG: M56 family metallopeptidase [Huintestinicola sp.]|uniref:M56 family metallopeptidase n=1 Tax=Huintestinicola sp. TaxID=2981661 RepID=UPI003F118BA5
MTDIFIKVIEMSMTASIVIGVIIALRLFLRKAPKVFSYVLWAAAVFRLLCPISFELPSAPIPSVEIPYSTNVGDRNANRLFITHNDVEIAPAPEYSVPQNSVSQQVTAVSEPVSEIPVKREINYIAAASYIWAFAVIIMSFRGVASWVKLSRSLRSAQKMGGNVYVSPAISDPFIMGIIRPRIYLPTGLSCTESDLIIRHEKVHMHRGDHIAKLVMYIALCIHCFNPLVWLMFRLFERDMEMSCDERVTADMTKEQKADYSQTLLKISAKPTAAFTACFGENGTKQRVKNVLSFRKPAVWVIIVLAVAAVAVSVVLCVSRGTKSDLLTVPDVYTLNYYEAERILSNERLKYSAVFENSTAPKDSVIKTEPAKNEKIDADTPVIVYVSMGTENSSELVLSMGINGIGGYMREEDNNEYDLHRVEIVTEGDHLEMYRERFRNEYGEQIDEYIFSVEYILIPLYDETGEKVVDYFRQDCRVMPISPYEEMPDSAEEAVKKFLDNKYGIVINSINENDYVYGDAACELLKKNFASDFCLPVDEKYTESALYYGGYEFKPEVNAEIYSMNEGTVLFAGYKNGFGNTVLIDHGDNNIFLYAHMNSISVSVNDSVRSGTVIGYAGDSGFTPHFRLLVYNIYNKTTDNPELTPVLSEDDEYNDWTDTIKLIPLTEEHQRTVEISSASPDVLYSDSRNCLFTDGTGGLYLYNFENRELMLAVDFLASMELVNSGIAIEENRYGGASIYSSITADNDRCIYFSFETKGKEKRGGAFNGRSYYLDVINSKLSISGTSGSLYEAAVTEPIDPAEHPDTISSSLAMINKRDFVYMVNSGTDEGHLPMIRLARNINGNVEYFDPFEKALTPQERKAPEEWGLSFTAEAAGNDSVKLKLSCTCERELTTGSYSIIQKKGIYGWSEPTHCAEFFMSDHTWTAEAMIIPNDSERELNEEWGSIYGQLAPGYYRIGKYFRIDNEEEKLLYAYFSIE